MANRAARLVVATGLFLLVSGTAVASLNHYGRTIIQTGPVAYWRLGQSSGSTAYARVGQYDGTYQGAPTLGTPGLIANNDNKAPEFDGTDDRVTVDDFTDRSKSLWTQGYTLTAWVMTTTAAGEEHILSFNRTDGGADIAIFRDEPTDKFKFHDCEGSGCVTALSTTTPAVGKIYQVAVTVDAAGEGHLYVNGLTEATFSSTRTPLQYGRFSIGADYDRGPKVTSFWHGKIDEVAIYNRALSPVEVAAQWAQGSG